MNDDLMFEYLLQMGALTPEQAELKRKQAQVDALRKGGMAAPEGQMIGKHYVAPSMTQYMAQLGQSYAAGKGQDAVDAGLRGMNTKQGSLLRELQMEAERRRRQQLGNSVGGSSWGADLGME